MNNQQREQRKDPAERSALEKHFQTILLTVITTVMIAGVTKIFSINEQVIIMNQQSIEKDEKISNLQTTLNKLQLDMMDVKNRLMTVEFNQNKK